MDHCHLFREADLAWPPEIPPPSLESHWFGTETCGFYYIRGDLSDRAAELMFFLMVRFPYLSADPEMVDVNFSVNRLTQQSGDEDANPWRSVLPCITGTAHPVVRYKLANGKHVVRPIFGCELMQIIGWSFADWAPHGERFDDSLLVSPAGNAFSAFALLPAALTALCMFGSYIQVIEAGLEEAPLEVSDSEVSS